jgi:hypothetical protein
VWEGHAHTGSRDSERRGIGKDTYRLSRDGEEESEQMILAVLLEGSFSAPFLFVPIHSHLHNQLELLLPSVLAFRIAMLSNSQYEPASCTA